MLLRVLARGDVADGRRHQDSLGALQRAQHDLDGKLASILPPSVELNPCADLLRQRFGSSPGSVGDQPLRKALRDDALYLLAQELIAAVPELFLRLGVQQDDLPALVYHHHSIRSRLQKATIPSLHLGQMLLRVLARGDVADGRRHQDSLGALQRAQHDLDGKLASILPPSVELNPCADLLRQRFGSSPGSVGDQPLRKALRNDVLYLPAYEFIAEVSELFLRLGVQQDDLPVLVHHHHPIRSRLQQPAVPCLRFLLLAQIAADLGKPAQVSR